MTTTAPCALTYVVGNADVHGHGVEHRMHELLDAIRAALAVDVVRLSVPGIPPGHWSSSDVTARSEPAAAEEVVSVPVHFQGRAVGRATASRPRRPWTADEMSRFEALGAIASVVLHHEHHCRSRQPSITDLEQALLAASAHDEGGRCNDLG